MGKTHSNFDKIILSTMVVCVPEGSFLYKPAVPPIGPILCFEHASNN